MKTITSTELKQKTKSVLDEISKNPNEPIIVQTYGEPKAVVVSFHLWEKKIKRKPRMSWSEFEKRFVVKEGAAIDSAQIVREWRDAE